ncbi:MAG: putative RNA binding protein with dsRBD fold (UPF0201 family) [Natronomonas sp.]|jgi:predicted RNA binding protein with dsRBD fold (UPF0201 family)
MNYAIEAEITAPVFDTEIQDRVAAAITEIFPEAEPEFQYGELTATVHSLDQFSEQLHRQEILDTARGVFFDNRTDDSFSFRLKKQAAFQGLVNFVVDEPGELGGIAVRVRVEEPSVEEFVAHIAPRTEGGKPVEE